MDITETITRAYARWDAGDTDGFLEVFAEDATFVIPGATPVSGNHDKVSFRRVLERVADATRAGHHRQKLVCTYPGDSGAALVFDTHIGAGEAERYHSIHEWVFRGERPHVWMLYVHEYDTFARAWR